MELHIAEYEYLENIYQKSGQQIIIIYGINQIGKTSLLKKFSQIHDGVFFYSEAGSAKEIKRNLSSQINMETAFLDDVPTYSDIFNKIFENTKTKQVLIFDNFHNIIKSDVTFFQELTTYIQINKKECMICFGSSHIGFVENQMISKIGQSATSITGFLKMQVMSFDEVASYFPTYTTNDVLKIYSLLGGHLGYITCMSKKLSVDENICKYLLSEHSFIFAKMHQYIEEQLRETSVYYTILGGLAKGKSKLNELYHYTGFSRAKISVYLKTLMELEFVEKVFSIDTPGRVNVQKGIYRISNPLLNFYFKFIYPNESAYVLLETDNFYNKYIINNLRELMELQFSRICRNMVISMNENEDLPFYCDVIGEWIGKKGTIPIIAKNSQEEFLVGFCNDTENPFSYDEYKEYSLLLDEAKIKPQYIYLFSLNGFDELLQKHNEDEHSLILLDLE